MEEGNKQTDNSANSSASENVDIFQWANLTDGVKNDLEVEFVLIDGLGDDNWFRLPNLFTLFLKRKIIRRWDKFYRKHILIYNKNI